MADRDRRTMDRSIALLTMAGLLASCGGASDDAATARTTDGAAPPASAPVAAPGSADGTIARADFVMCPALEPIAADLAAIVGFAMDRERGLERLAGECFVRSEDSGFVSAAVAPAFVRSTAMQAEGYEGRAEPATGPGDGALIVRDALQPHVIFELRGNIIDVGAEADGTGAPDDATMLRLATAVRDALLAANGG